MILPEHLNQDTVKHANGRHANKPSWPRSIAHHRDFLIAKLMTESKVASAREACGERHTTQRGSGAPRGTLTCFIDGFLEHLAINRFNIPFSHGISYNMMFIWGMNFLVNHYLGLANQRKHPFS